MELQINRNRLFLASCVALTVTAMTFAIRAGILTELSEAFGLSDTQLGWINAMGFLGFPVATMIGGPLYNTLGPKRFMWVAFVCHILGLILTITAGGFLGLLVSTFLIGFANGSVEAACNPMIADMFPENKTTMLNKFHVWFPGGIVIGSLVVLIMESMGLGWQEQIAVMLIPTALYAFLIFGQTFPKLINSEGFDFKKLFPPIYLTIVLAFVLIAASDLTLYNWLGSDLGLYIKIGLLVLVAVLVYIQFGPLYSAFAFAMSLTATSELGTQQWVERILGSAGAHPMLILILVTGLMSAGRYFGGPLIHRFKPIGVLLGSSIVAAVGLYLMSIATGPMVYVSAVLFAIGVMYFWPTMLGSVAEYTPETGALGLSFLGGVGMFAVSLWQPVIGGWLDSERAAALAEGLSEQAAELAAGQAALANIAIFPLILIAIFAGLFIYLRNRKEPEPEREIA
ncbi:MAG: MFS transporter [Bacteroidota bacterium]